jgi:hypothetical protein
MHGASIPRQFGLRSSKLHFWTTLNFPQLTGACSQCTIQSAMVEASQTKERRSSRVFSRIPVRAAGKDVEGRKFRENSQTIVINAHGALLYLQPTLEIGADLTLINPVTEEEQECRIVYLGDTSDKGTRVGVEFLCPCPHFWGVEFAPEDWPARSSSPRI